MSTGTTPKFDLHQTVTDHIISHLEKGIIPWRKPWSSAGPPMNAISKQPYKGINLWMLLCLNYESNLWLTWEQLKYAGGNVLRGEKGQIIIYWQVPDKKNEDEATKPRLRYRKVFNIDQCTGLPPSIAVSSYEKQTDPLKACEMVMNNYYDMPNIVGGQVFTSYDHLNDEILMPDMNSFESIEDFYYALFRQAIRSTGHRTRLDRKTVGDVGETSDSEYSQEEMIVELGSCFLASYAGILEREISNRARYIQDWLQALKNDRRLIVFASTQAQKACDYILDGKRKTEVLEQPVANNEA